MSFANKQILWLLLVLPPALAGFFWWAMRRRQELMTQFIRARLLPGLISGVSTTRQKIRLTGVVLAVVFLILALARPQWGFIWEEVKQRGLDIVVAIDTSKSMLADDIAPNRLARAKLAAVDLMQQAKSDRLGLVAFAGSAFLECPLTIDDSAFRQSVEALDVNSISQGGTAIADAIQAAMDAFKEGENHKVLVLFTDGEDQDSGAVEAAKKAAEAGLRIFTVGIGTTDGSIVQVTDAKGHADYIRDEHDNVHKSHLNEDLLRQIAGATEGGFYLPLRAKTIDTLYAQGLAPLPKSESQEKLVKRYQERYHWPLAFAILLLAVEMIFPERPREQARQSTAASNSRASTSKARAASSRPPSMAGATRAAVVLLLLAFPFLLRASPSSALHDYKAGQYDESLKEYDKLIERKSDDPRLRYDAGAAAYRAKQLDEAVKHFDEALSTPDLKLQQQAYYNRGNTYYYLGERNPDPSKRNEVWQKSLQDFESSLKLNPQDQDAKFNYQFVKKKLEELKQQQQQQKNQQNKSGDKNQDQDQQQQKDQDQSSQSQQDKSSQKQDSQQQKEEDKKQQQAAAQSQPKESQDKKEAQQANASEEQKENAEEKEAEAAATAAGQMTPQQARQLLDAQKGEETMLPPKPPEKPIDRSKPIRDW